MSLSGYCPKNSIGKAVAPSGTTANSMEICTMVPSDDFTPHGYLDNPYHSWKLNPSGVVRSIPPLGMGWHVPNLGSYVRNQFQYTAHLTLGLRVGKQVMITPEDFQRYGCAITC